MFLIFYIVLYILFNYLNVLFGVHYLLTWLATLWHMMMKPRLEKYGIHFTILLHLLCFIWSVAFEDSWFRGKKENIKWTEPLGWTDAVPSRMISIERVQWVWFGVIVLQEKAESEMRTVLIFKWRQVLMWMHGFQLWAICIFLCSEGNWMLPPDAFVKLSITCIWSIVLITRATWGILLGA